MTTTTQRAAARVIDAWDSTVLPVANDGRLQEAMEDLRAASEAAMADTTPTLREAAQQALEALTSLDLADMSEHAERAATDAIINLDAALAEQAAEQARPVAVNPAAATVRDVIASTLGFAFEPDEMQTVNAADLLRLAEALLAAPPAPARQEWQPLTQSHVDYVLQYGGRCRDCADENGVCPGSGLPCWEAEKAVWYVLRALNYGFKHGYITAAPAEGEKR